MDIIIVSNRFARPFKVSPVVVLIWSLVLLALTVVLTLVVVFPQLSYARAENGGKVGITDAIEMANKNHQANIDALAMQLGEIQARLMRLDALGDKLANKAGVKQEELDAYSKKPNRGGPELISRELSENELQQKIDELMADFEHQSDRLAGVESLLVHQGAKQNSLPSSSPIEAAYNSSSYGWRLDPFTGRKAFHEGLDFTAEYGAPVYAAADGVVTAAEQTPDYGRIVKIDHGNGFETRYAHASFLWVREGERVVRGQKIALVGSSGRSTGPHLHFEVRLDGLPLDPRRYLKDTHS